MVEIVHADAEISALLRAMMHFQVVAAEQELPDLVRESGWNPLPEAVERHWAFPLIAGILNEIEERLDEIGYEAPTDRTGSYGTHYVRAPARKIVRGFLEPVHVAPIVPSGPPLTMALLTTVEGFKEKVCFEHHGPVGWHYHYCDKDGRRSDTILSWDTHHAQQKKIRPLFWERHSENNAKFQARATLWADKKRQSIYETCRGDLKRAITEFRHPSDEASAVSPAGARLTQSPSRPAQHSATPSKTSKRRK